MHQNSFFELSKIFCDFCWNQNALFSHSHDPHPTPPRHCQDRRQKTFHSATNSRGSFRLNKADQINLRISIEDSSILNSMHFDYYWYCHIYHCIHAYSLYIYIYIYVCVCVCVWACVCVCVHKLPPYFLLFSLPFLRLLILRYFELYIFVQ